MFDKPKMLLGRLVLVLLGVFTIPSSLQAHTPESFLSINLVTEINHPYVYYKKDSKELTGIAYDMVKELFKRAGIDNNLIVLPWLRAIKKLDSDNNTCLFIMNRTEQREQKYTWVGPMILGSLAVYKRPDSKIIVNSVQDLKGHTVIGKIDGMAIQDLKREVDFNVISTSSDEQSARLLYRKRGDLWATGDIDGPVAVQRVGLPMPDLVFKRAKTDLSMGCSLNLSPEVLAKLKDAYDSMADYREITINKYLPSYN